VLPTPDDTVLVAVSIKGSTFLAWVQQVLSIAPFFVQTSRVAIWRDLKRDFACQVNRLQVLSRAPPIFTRAASCFVLTQIENRAFSPTEVVRLVTSAALLKSPASQNILGNETVAKAFQSPPDGIVDAVADAINDGTLAQIWQSESEYGIRDSVGEPLNSACAIFCDAGSGVQGDGTNVSTGIRPNCTTCPAGSYSAGGKAAECRLCAAGLRLCVGCERCTSPYVLAGYFQPDKGQTGCLGCEGLGDYFQESQAQTSCEACPVNTRRYVSVLSSANRSSCQCKDGATLRRLTAGWRP
jgi:hypothetical protein